jgi:uncharacterized membrane protein
VIRGFAGWLSSWPTYRWACLMVAGYFAIALAGTWANYVELHLNALGTFDLSIGQQSLASTVHSNQPYPFYEATNCGRNDRCSFLLVHPVFLGYLVAVPYAVAPSAFTLFALQDAALALAALPLFAIAQHLTRSNRLSLVVAGVYLVWLPAFSGIFSFHWEGFIPLEFFLVFWLWLTQRFAWAIPVVLLSYVTLEIMPVLLFFLAVYFALPWARPSLRLLRLRLRLIVGRPDPAQAGNQSALGRISKSLYNSAMLRASIFLAIGSVAAYVVLHEFVTAGGWLLGLPPLPAEYNIPLTQPVHSETFTLANLETAWLGKLVFWLVIYATLAMVPLLAPRTLILSAPWIVLSLFATSGYYAMGHQYGFISAALLMIGFVYGVAWLKGWVNGPHDWAERRRKKAGRPSAGPTPAVRPAGEPGPTPPWTEASGGEPGTGVAAQAEWTEESAEAKSLDERTEEQLLEELRALDVNRPTAAPAVAPRKARRPSKPAPPQTGGAPPRGESTLDLAHRQARRQRRAAVIVGVVLVSILAVNLFLNPLNPLAAPFTTHRPFASQSELALSGGVNSSGYNHVMRALSLISPNAVLGVSPALFTLVANDPYAYPLMSGFNIYDLPFNATTGTEFVLLVDRGGTHLPPFLAQTIYDPSQFGVRAWVPTTYLGGVLLFQRGYTGATEVFGESPRFSGGTYTAMAGLVPGKAGHVYPDPGSTSGLTIAARPSPVYPGFRLTGRVFVGPALSLPGGTYNVTVDLSGEQIAPNPRASGGSPVVLLRLMGFQDRVLQHTLNLSWFPTGNRTGAWTTITLQVTLPYPVLSFGVIASNLRSWFEFQVDYVTITPVSGP